MFQYPIAIDGQRRRIDFAYPELRLAIEVDGWEHHLQFDQWQDDHVRQNDLVNRGWVVIRFTWTQVVEDPGYVADVIARALRRATSAP